MLFHRSRSSFVGKNYNYYHEHELNIFRSAAGIRIFLRALVSRVTSRSEHWSLEKTDTGTILLPSPSEYLGKIRSKQIGQQKSVYFSNRHFGDEDFNDHS